MTPGTPGAGPEKRLLDVNVLLAAIWTSHPHHSKASAWLHGKRVLLCPLAELGFLRISTQRKALGVRMEDARNLLAQFATDFSADRIPDDLPPLDSHPRKSEEVTDCYLADLAARHGARLGTLDTSIVHASVAVIP
jgi:toxin-antitoxin system PIN domain toxin